MSTTTWVHVSRSRPCPVCGRPDWCLVTADEAACICPRTESPRWVGEAGYLYRLADGGNRVRRVVVEHRLVPTAQIGEFAERCHRSVAPGRLGGLADSLGLSAASLTALRVGWSADHLAWTFPMSDAEGRVVGVRLRTPGGSKFAVRGGKEGLFLPAADPVPGEPLLVAEGPTDAAALFDLGFPNAVGRPSCTGGVRHLVALVRLRRPAGVVIVSDADEPGRLGAGRLATVLQLHAPAVKVIEPPDGVKDARAWKRAGVTRAEVEQVIRAADVRRFGVQVTWRTRT